VKCRGSHYGERRRGKLPSLSIEKKNKRERFLNIGTGAKGSFREVEGKGGGK